MAAQPTPRSGDIGGHWRTELRRIFDSVDHATGEQQTAFQDFRVAEAAFRLEPSEWTQPDVIKAAVQLVSAGLDGPNLATLAGDDHADWREVRRALDLALQDLGQEPLGLTQAFRVLLDRAATDLVDGRHERDAVAKRIARGWTAIRFAALDGTARDVAVAAVRWDDLGGEPYGPAPDELLEASRAYLADTDHRLPPMGPR